MFSSNIMTSFDKCDISLDPLLSCLNQSARVLRERAGTATHVAKQALVGFGRRLAEGAILMVIRPEKYDSIVVGGVVFALIAGISTLLLGTRVVSLGRIPLLTALSIVGGGISLASWHSRCKAVTQAVQEAHRNRTAMV